jgi:hypothetical protein
MAAALVDQLLQRSLDHRLIIGDEPRLVAPFWRSDGAREPVLERRDAFVPVHAGGGAVADGDEADDQLFAHRAANTSEMVTVTLFEKQGQTPLTCRLSKRNGR